MHCARHVDDSIPPFQSVYERVRDSDRWTDREQEEYATICERDKAFPDEDTEENAERRTEAEDSVEVIAIGFYDEVVGIIKDKFAGKDKTVVYRAIKVANPEKFIDDLKTRGKAFYDGHYRGVGRFWSWDLEHARPYWALGARKDLVILEAEADCEDVDFTATIMAFLLYTEGDEYDEQLGENEMQLGEDRKVFLKRVWKVHECRREVVDINSWIWT